jgi:hypothetical protein
MRRNTNKKQSGQMTPEELAKFAGHLGNALMELASARALMFGRTAPNVQDARQGLLTIEHELHNLKRYVAETGNGKASTKLIAWQITAALALTSAPLHFDIELVEDDGSQLNGEQYETHTNAGHIPEETQSIHARNLRQVG